MVKCEWCFRKTRRDLSWKTERITSVINYMPEGTLSEPVYDNLETLWFCSHSHRNEYLYGL